MNSTTTSNAASGQSATIKNMCSKCYNHFLKTQIIDKTSNELESLSFAHTKLTNPSLSSSDHTLFEQVPGSKTPNAAGFGSRWKSRCKKCNKKVWIRKRKDNQQKEKGVVSNKKKKLQRRMTIGELKEICSRPEVVEVWDTTAADPKLLVFLKAYRNTVPVPTHWRQKAKLLQGKRGIEKQPFQIPDFIAATGIEKVRQAYIEKEDMSKNLKQKQREPKMGKMDIDYQILHDAFFKYQTKPKLTNHGDLYHERKEFEVKLSEMKKPAGTSSHWGDLEEKET